jgi:hypothetical protein
MRAQSAAISTRALLLSGGDVDEVHCLAEGRHLCVGAAHWARNRRWNASSVAAVIRSGLCRGARPAWGRSAAQWAGLSNASAVWARAGMYDTRTRARRPGRRRGPRSDRAGGGGQGEHSDAGVLGPRRGRRWSTFRRIKVSSMSGSSPPRLDPAEDSDSRGRGPLDVAGRHRAYPAPTGPSAGPGPSPALGTPGRARPAHPGPSPAGFSEPPRSVAMSGPCTETEPARPRQAPRLEEPAARHPLRRGQNCQTTRDHHRTRPGQTIKNKLRGTGSDCHPGAPTAGDAPILPDRPGAGAVRPRERDPEVRNESSVPMRETAVSHLPYVGDARQTRQLGHDLLYMVSHGLERTDPRIRRPTSFPRSQDCQSRDCFSVITLSGFVTGRSYLRDTCAKRTA